MRKCVVGQLSTWAVLPVLSASAAIAQDQPQQDYTPTIMSESGGAMMMTLPDVPSGVTGSGGPITGSGVQTIPGVMMGFDIGRKLGTFAGLDLIGNLSLFIGIGGNTATSTTTLSGPGTIVLSGNTQSTATISLDTTTGPGGATANASVSLTTPGGGATITQNTTSPVGGGVVSPAVTLTGDNTGVIFSGVATDGTTPSAAAFAAAADPRGYVFVGVGDLTGTTIRTNTYRSFVYYGADASFGLSPPSVDPTSFTPYITAGYRALRQEISTVTTFDLPEVAGATTTFPTLGLRRFEQLDANYYGGGVGLSVSHTLEHNITLNGAIEGGIRAFDATYRGRDLAIFPIPTGGNTTDQQTFDVGRASAEEHGVAWFAKGEAGFNFPIAANLLLGFTGTVEYISKVPTLTRSGPTVQSTQGAGSGSLTYPNGAGTQSTSIAFADAWNFGIKATLSGSF